jgi:outer membrane protein OmpA-like peptidoglycan-associated protein
MSLKKILVAVAFVASSIGLVGCMTTNPYTGESEVSKTTIGTGIGAGAGAIAGQLIGHSTEATIIGAGIGAAVGGITGNYMDRQTAELRQQLESTGVRVVRLGNGDIQLVMPGDITFENDRADIRPQFYNTLNSVAIVLKKYNKTTVKVAGYASSTGTAQHNQILSEQRAQSVANYLVAQKIDGNRLMAVGYGQRYPVASNATHEGQARNRRVEITIHQLAN